MTRSFACSLLLGALLPGCNVYGGIFDDVGETGGSTTGGLTGSGGTQTGGNTGGGTGGAEPSGGSGGSSGGSESGGSDSGGTGSAGGGTSEVLLDDLEQGSVYTNSPFMGGWDRYIDTGAAGGTWVAASPDDMIQPSPDEAGNHAIRINATGFGDDSWGLGVYISLNQDGALSSIDLSGYSKMRLRGRSTTGSPRPIRVAIEDQLSRSAPCPDTDCVPHALIRQISLPLDTWEEFEFDLTSSRSPAFDPTTAFAIHFTMDPPNPTAPATSVPIDFWIDDIYFVE